MNASSIWLEVKDYRFDGEKLEVRFKHDLDQRQWWTFKGGRDRKTFQRILLAHPQQLRIEGSLAVDGNDELACTAIRIGTASSD